MLLSLCMFNKFVVYNAMYLPLSILDKCFHPTLTKYRIQKSKLYSKYKQLKRAAAAGQGNSTFRRLTADSRPVMSNYYSVVAITNIPKTLKMKNEGK